MHVVHAAGCSSEDNLNFTTEASTIGLKPGEWPEELEFHDGSKVCKLFHSMSLSDYGESVWHRYVNLNDVTLTVYND